MVGRPRRAPDRARLPRAAPASLLLMPPAARHREVRRRPPRRAPARGVFAVARRHRRLGRRQEVPGCLACRSEYPARAVAETGVAGSRPPPTPSLPCGSAARCCSPGSPAAYRTFWCLDALQRCRIGDRCAVGILVGKPAPAASLGVSRGPGRRYGEVACLAGDPGGVQQVDHGEEDIKRHIARVLVIGAVTASSSAPG